MTHPTEYGGLINYWMEENESIKPWHRLISPHSHYDYLLIEQKGIPGVIGSQIVCITHDGEYLFTLG